MNNAPLNQQAARGIITVRRRGKMRNQHFPPPNQIWRQRAIFMVYKYVYANITFRFLFEYSVPMNADGFVEIFCAAVHCELGLECAEV